MNILNLLADLSPWLAIIGFLLISIKMFVSDLNIKKIMCIHIMVLSGFAALCYMIRIMVKEPEWIILATGSLWLLIGCFNYIEWQVLKNRTR